MLFTKLGSNVAAVCWSVNGAFVTRPINLAVSTNDASEFTCTTNHTNATTSPNPAIIHWWYMAGGGSTKMRPIVSLCEVYSRKDKSVYHTESAAGGACNLIVNSTQLMNAGRYLCDDERGKAMSTAELVVLGNPIIALI